MVLQSRTTAPFLFLAIIGCVQCGAAGFAPQSLALSPSRTATRALQSMTTKTIDDQNKSNQASAVSSPSNKNEKNDNAETEVSTTIRGGAAMLQQKKMEPLPTLQDYRKFALPCLGLWVAGPLLSLVDTAFVGLSAGSSAVGSSSASAVQLAALGPATTFFDGATYLFAFLNVATTNLYSSSRAQYGSESVKTESVVRTAARVALVSGFSIMVFLLLFSRPLLGLYIGSEASSQPNLLDWATDYVKIRSLSMPTSLLLGVLQASLLGAKDSVTPLIAVVYSCVVNIIGDFIGVRVLGMGLRGAAIATTLAQWASTWALLRPARQKLVQDHNLGLLNNKYQKSSNDNDTVTSKTFMAFAAPVLTLILGKLAAFGFMTNAAASLPGQPTTLAAHQIILSTFFFISPFLEVISQTAQTFLPPFYSPVREYIADVRAKMKKNNNKDNEFDISTDTAAQEWLGAAFTVATRLLGIGILVATAMATLVSLIPAFFGNLITSDTTVQKAVQPLAKYLWMGAFLTAPVAVSEGVLLARRELPFLAGVYVISSIILPYALVEIKKRNSPVAYVWGCFAAFQLFRASCFTGKIWGGRMVQSIQRKLKLARRRTSNSSAAQKEQ